jgi:hypothetical protein
LGFVDPTGAPSGRALPSGSLMPSSVLDKKQPTAPRRRLFMCMADEPLAAPPQWLNDGAKVLATGGEVGADFATKAGGRAMTNTAAATSHAQATAVRRVLLLRLLMGGGAGSLPRH